MMKIKSVLFARVSTPDQAIDGYSLPAQVRLLKDYAYKQNFQIVKEFVIPESARTHQERKMFNEFLEYIKKDSSIKVVLWEKVDRSARNFKDSILLDDWLNEDENRQIHFVKQSLVMHKNAKSHEKFQWDIYVALARQYSNNLSEETKKGLLEKAIQGWYPGNQKRGYKSIGEIGHKVWVINSDQPDSTYIARAFAYYNTGNFTLSTLSKQLYKEGWVIQGKAISKSELHKLITDPFYCGEFIWRGKLYKKANHTALISKELFYSVQERLQRQLKGGKYQKHLFLFGHGLLKCFECDRNITGEVQKGHVYYHCTKHANNCSQTAYIREERIDEQIYTLLDGFKIQNARLLEWIRKALKESHKDESNYHYETVQVLEKQKQAIEKRLDTLYDDRLDEKISKEFYTRKKEQYESELNSVLEAINKHTKANINYQELGMNIFELSQKGREIYEKKALTNEKRELLQFIFSNLKLKDGKVVPTAHNGFEVVAARAGSGNWLSVSVKNLIVLITLYHLKAK